MCTKALTKFNQIHYPLLSKLYDTKRNLPKPTRKINTNTVKGFLLVIVLVLPIQYLSILGVFCCQCENKLERDARDIMKTVNQRLLTRPACNMLRFRIHQQSS